MPIGALVPYLQFAGLLSKEDLHGWSDRPGRAEFAEEQKDEKGS
jgi:hypothetical protein